MRADYGYLLICLACGGLACASDHPPSARSEATREPESTPVLGIAFHPMYSAYDGEHEFRVPVRVTGAEGELEVSTEPPDFVDVEPSDDGVILTTRQAGIATIEIKDGVGQYGWARLTVTKNEPDDVDLGAERYNHYLNVHPPAFFDGGALSFPEGGLPDGFRLPEGSVRIDPPDPCASCHSPTGPASPAEPGIIDGEYTPQQIAGLSDDELTRIFTEGKKPEGAHYRFASGYGAVSDEKASELFGRFHAYALSPETSRALVAYLRQLEPKSRGELDFGGLYGRRSQ